MKIKMSKEKTRNRRRERESKVLIENNIADELRIYDICSKLNYSVIDPEYPIESKDGLVGYGEIGYREFEKESGYKIFSKIKREYKI